jgi:pyruvate formate lyase activating enzyme
VLVPGLTDDPREVERVATFAAGLGNVERIDVLPFHKLGAPKYAQLGIPFPLAGTPVPRENSSRASRHGSPPPSVADRLARDGPARRPGDQPAP